MKYSLIPILFGALLLLGCTDKEAKAEAVESDAPIDLLPSENDVKEIDQAAKAAADAITEENADSALDNLESAIDSDTYDE